VRRVGAELSRQPQVVGIDEGQQSAPCLLDAAVDGRSDTERRLRHEPRAADALAALHAAGIETMVLKGIALAVMHYSDPGDRPMDDIDVLVRPEEANRALALLAAEGWTADEEPTGVGLKVVHAKHLHDAGDRRLDLHRYALERSRPTSRSGPRPSRSR
jgi:hypothetical protein